jgi:hypothetical protein
MIYIDLNNAITRTHEDDKRKKTITLGEVENGWVLLKRIEKKNDEGIYDPENCEEKVYVYRENPMNLDKDEDEINMGDAVEQLADKLM